MIKYNWETLSKATDNNCQKIIEYFVRVLNKEQVIRDYHISALYDKNKPSFLLNPKKLLLSNFSDSEICTYIYLASLRNYADVMNSKNTNVPLYAVSGKYTTMQLKMNRLLEVGDSEIKLIYEVI